MKLYIKNMNSIRCKMIVKAELDKLGLHYGAVNLGEVEIKGEVTDKQHNELKVALLKYGLELIADKRADLIKKIKEAIVEVLHYTDEGIKSNFSDYLSTKLQYDYTYLSNVFSEMTGFTLEQYRITQKIERVKELLINSELTLTEISYKLNYSSVAHLSNQFRKITGLKPTYFKQLNTKKRR